VSGTRLVHDPELAARVRWPPIPSLSVALCRLACTRTSTARAPAPRLVAGQTGSANEDASAATASMDVADDMTHPAAQIAAEVDETARTARKAAGARPAGAGKVAGLVVCRAAAFMLGLGGVQALVEAARRDPEVREPGISMAGFTWVSVLNQPLSSSVA
jgi:hypothetical protein